MCVIKDVCELIDLIEAGRELDMSLWESVMELSNLLMEKMVHIDARIIRFKGDNEVLGR